MSSEIRFQELFIKAKLKNDTRVKKVNGRYF